ncbi:hypothetical protein [Actinomadura macra]|uniref:hypothetical protein n=1 Tax=Actinomadura macra TaxID=46164 RepID=UPI000834A4AA|nr:hypothetical protein [Actinomadura macra]
MAPTHPAQARTPLGLPCGPRSHDELAIGVLLTAQWMLATGRRLEDYPALHHLEEDQLIEFWADGEMDGG